MNLRRWSYVFVLLAFVKPVMAQQGWQSKFVSIDKDGKLHYTADEKGNIIPDFSMVGYHAGDRPIPNVAVVKTVSPGNQNDQQTIQQAIDEVSNMPLDEHGFRGAILVKKGLYKIPGSIHINTSGIVLRGEGDETILLATGKGQRSLIMVTGKGNIINNGSKKIITDSYVPVGATSFQVTDTKGLKTGDAIIVYRPATAAWISAIKMDQIQTKDTAVMPWKPEEYNFRFERKIVALNDNTITIDAPIVMELNGGFGQAEIYKYSFDGRIEHCAVEDLSCDSEYENDTDEDHGWNAVYLNTIQNGWVRNVSSRHFGYACVNLDALAKNMTVDHCNCYEPVSQIIGGRRYSFNNNGQLNLFTNCYASHGRHDYVTGSRVCGPNVFYNCKAEDAHADIGPHHRWAMGTLFDNIVTDGEINVQDRGDWGTGHGWAGVNQVVWNCTVKAAVIQNPWATGKNYVIGLHGNKLPGRLKGKPDGEWEGWNKAGLTPNSLFIAQLKQANKQLPATRGFAVHKAGLYNEVAALLRTKVLQNAAQYIQEPIVTITNFPAARSAGGIHDFYSEADYWWPDPDSPDSPYIQKDGMTNPDNFTRHREAMIRFSTIVATLGSAYRLTGDESYAKRIMEHCAAWFLEDATYMKPSMLYAQAIKGRATGRGIGIIDTIHLMEVVKALEAIRNASLVDGKMYAAIQQWFQQYIGWLTSHPYGIDEMNAKNNHGTCWVMQVGVFAKFTGDEKMVDFCRGRYRNVLLPQQMSADGSFPLELKRTKPYGYSLFNLDAMTTICQELSNDENDLWHYTTSDGRSIKDAVAFLYPFLADKSLWTFQKDVMYWEEWPVAQPALLFAANAYENQQWLNTWRILEHYPTNAEVLRNLPVRQPLLWLEK